MRGGFWIDLVGGAGPVFVAPVAHEFGVEVTACKKVVVRPDFWRGAGEEQNAVGPFG
jgi:hypothetical protein